MSVRWGATVAALLIALTGCGGPTVSDETRTKAERFAEREMAPLRLAPVASWYADGLDGGMVCGEIEAPAALRPQRASLRYVYSELSGSPVGQIEMHEGVVGFGRTSAALLAENRAMFDSIWSEHCRSAAPVGRRIAGWFDSTKDDGVAETPLTNAYVADLLAKNGKR